MSTMTGRSTSVASTSAPHTPSSSGVITKLKASMGTGPFFHARLQEGQRIEDESVPDVRYEVSAYAIGPKVIAAPGGALQQKSKKLGANECEEMPRVSQRHDRERAVDDAQVAYSSPFARSVSTTVMSPDKTMLGKIVQDVHASLGAATPAPQHYHYLTRSQSASAAADAGRFQQAPKMQKHNASYSPGFGTPAYRGVVENVLAAPVPTWCPTRGKYLSPIEEVSFFPEKQGDSASLHSTTSAQSNLFIHRAVRRTASNSTFNSVHSGAPRSPDDPAAPHSTSPSRSYGHPRPVIALPVIPASPRESQNVFEQDPAPPYETSLVYPMPVAFSSPAEFAAYRQQEEQDLGATLSTPRFAVPRYLPDSDPVDEEDLGEAQLHRISILSQEPSLLARSESVRTELTYLTAPDSRPGSRRASGITPGDLEAGQSTFIDGDTTLVDPSSRPSPAARLKASLDTLLFKSPKMRKSPGGLNNSPTADGASTMSTRSTALKLLAQMNDAVKKHAPWRDGNNKPAEVLFWTGFLAPWCWLVGGWMLSRSGQTKLEGLPNHAKEPGLSPRSTSIQLRRPASRETRELSEKHETEGAGNPAPSIWQAAKNSSVELLESLRGPRGKEPPTTTVRGVMMHKDMPIPVMITTRVDPWVVRCRVAAIVSGMFILALCIVALVVLVRSL